VGVINSNSSSILDSNSGSHGYGAYVSPYHQQQAGASMQQLLLNRHHQQQQQQQQAAQAQQQQQQIRDLQAALLEQQQQLAAAAAAVNSSNGSNVSVASVYDVGMAAAAAAAAGGSQQDWMQLRAECYAANGSNRVQRAIQLADAVLLQTQQHTAGLSGSGAGPSGVVAAAGAQAVAPAMLQTLRSSTPSQPGQTPGQPHADISALADMVAGWNVADSLAGQAAHQQQQQQR
jgi:hypothetical protein